MSAPLISVVVETVTAREHGLGGTLADALSPALSALDQQSYPQASIELIVVVDDAVAQEDRDELRQRHPLVRIENAPACNYYQAKNSGAAAARGEWVALLDGDCAPAPDWLEWLASRRSTGVEAVAGRTRYAGGSWAERIFSVPDFANVLDEGGGRASGFNLNNVLFRRDVLLANPLEARIARNGACFLLFHRLRAAGADIVYEPGAVVAHGNDVAGFGFLRKHFDRGYDSVTVLRLDEPPVLRGTRLFRRFGALALIGFAGRQIVRDAWRLVRHHRQIGIAPLAVPLYWGVTAALRLVALSGAMAAMAAPTVRPERGCQS